MTIPNSFISIGPIVSAVSRIHEAATTVDDMYPEFAPAFDEHEMFTDMVEAIESFGISVEFYNAVLRSRCPAWLDRGAGSWAIVPTPDELTNWYDISPAGYVS